MKASLVHRRLNRVEIFVINMYLRASEFEIGLMIKARCFKFRALKEEE